MAKIEEVTGVPRENSESFQVGILYIYIYIYLIYFIYLFKYACIKIAIIKSLFLIK
jgi:hypothetical protein